ncbi:MAG TPA: hypothetical protein VGN69_08015, partial [Solirubrobacteraceae bacterium]|nr:hypothetical protein [Solirubrobacteraceae bacterium]
DGVNRSGRVKVALSCHRKVCPGTLTLTFDGKVPGRTRPRARRSAATNLGLLGSAKFNLKSRNGKVTVRIGRAGVKLVKKYKHNLQVNATVVAASGERVSKTITFR